MAAFLRSYNALLIRRPMLASCGTAAFLFGAGDVIAQQAVERRGLEKHDLQRTARLVFYGGCIFGPCMTTWYSFLNKIKFSTQTKALATRVGLDQAVLTPVAVAFFFGSMSILEGKAHEARARIEAKYVPTLIRNWGVFIPTQLINFAVVPPHLRFVTVSVVSLFWNTYLSIENAKAEKAAEASAEVIEKVGNPE